MERLKSRLGWALAGALGIIVVLALARATVAGPLDPPGPVGSTMRTIDELVPSWGKTLTSSGGCASKRFTCVLPTAADPTGEAVLDHETGLVWQRVPDPDETYWPNALQSCRDADTGTRHGWRMPSYDELASLQDDVSVDGLPPGHPFTAGDTTVSIFSSTLDERSPGMVRARRLGTGIQMAVPKDEIFAARYWCVRGGTGVETNQDPPEWGRRFDSGGGCSSERFSCVFGGTAVLDRETGLVWERTPSTTRVVGGEEGMLACMRTTTGGRRGWRLPTEGELSSIFDPSIAASPSLPPGHPFAIAPALLGMYFLSSTWQPLAQSPPNYTQWVMSLTGLPAELGVGDLSYQTIRAWCVRGAE